ncbi:hypothetical protein BJF90_28580 [Pseudonocardia sp. CNS-004]|nr:hypothetical protein BJF90_28580 [Pseudonocardia sp. CNS-004]
MKPAELSAFQEFNLRMTRASGRNADEAISSGGGMAMAKLALSGWIRPTTLSRVARQLITERLDRKRLSRRRNIQTELHADVFTSLLAKTGPQFATFYTNNVAAAMHRFWAASLPRTSISRERLTSQWLNDYSNEVAEALYSVERLLRLLETGRCGDVTVVIASAIGQEEIVAENHHSFLSIISPERFANRVMDVGLDQFELCPTMVPDFTFRFRRSDTAEAAYARLATVEIDGVRPIETQERMHSKMLMASASRLAHIRHAYGDGDFKHPFTYSRSDDRTIHVSLQVDDYKGEPK